MGKDNSIVGKSFGPVTVICFDHYDNKRGLSFWKIKCSLCEKERVMSRNSILSKTLKSCGCLKLQPRPNIQDHPRFLDLKDQTINSWKILERDSNVRANWICQCICGKIKSVNTGNLSSGKSRSCGCVGKEITRRAKTLDLTGQQIGCYFVIEKSNRKTSKDSVHWECRCNCGEIKCLSTSVLRNKTTSGCKKCFGLLMRGNKHPNWNPEISDEERERRYKRRDSKEYERWTDVVKTRDKLTCQVTGRRGKICVHHYESYTSNPNLRFDVNNGVVLLCSLHKHFHSIYGNGNNTRKQFEEFLRNISNKQLNQFN